MYNVQKKKKKFASKYNRDSHLRVHIKIKPFMYNMYMLYISFMYNMFEWTLS